jgi:hypothetical protein
VTPYTEQKVHKKRQQPVAAAAAHEQSARPKVIDAMIGNTTLLLHALRRTAVRRCYYRPTTW